MMLSTGVPSPCRETNAERLNTRNGVEGPTFVATKLCDSINFVLSRCMNAPAVHKFSNRIHLATRECLQLTIHKVQLSLSPFPLPCALSQGFRHCFDTQQDETWSARSISPYHASALALSYLSTKMNKKKGYLTPNGTVNLKG